MPGLIPAGGIVTLLAGLFDMLDGAVAGISGKASSLNGFLDSVVDRHSHFLMFGGVLAVATYRTALHRVVYTRRCVRTSRPHQLD